MTEYLTSTELRQLTGYARAAAQEVWLQRFGIPFIRDGKRIIVSRFQSRERAEGKIVARSSGPNWGGVR